MNLSPASSVPKRASHLEHRLAASLYLDRNLSPDARRLSLMVTSWFHSHAQVAAHTERFRLMLGWDHARYRAARCELLLDGFCWGWIEPMSEVLGEDAGIWVWRDGDDSEGLARTLSRSEMVFPDGWDTSPRAMARWTLLFDTRVGMKRVARYWAHDDSEAAITLAVLSTGLRYDQRETATTLTPWMQEALKNIDVKGAVRRLIEWGYLERSEDRYRVRFTEMYADALADYADVQRPSVTSRQESDYEAAWCKKHDRYGWVGSEKLVRGEWWFYYTWTTTADLTFEVDGHKDTVPAGEVVYAGITSHPHMRFSEHLSESEGLSNRRWGALKQAAKAISPEKPAMRLSIVREVPATNMTALEASIAEAQMIHELEARGCPLFNRQHLEQGLDFHSLKRGHR